MIGYAGLSHLGIVSSIATASQGFEVMAYDASLDLCEDLTKGKLPVLEPDLPQILEISKNRIHFSANPSALSECDVIIFSRDVPTDDNNSSDLSPLRKLIEEIIPHAKTGSTLVILCQIPPGFTRALSQELANVLKQKNLNLYYQVETLIFGRAVERALKPERYIIGCADSRQSLPPAYAKVLAAGNCPVLPMRYESAELAKISINAFLAASVSTTNTLAEICEKVGADWSEIAPTLRLDRRIGPHAYLKPGLGLAGGNIERDLATIRRLASQFGAESAVTDSYLFHSQYRRNWVLQKLYQHLLTSQKNPVIAVWGLSYIPNTKSVKNSPTLELLDSLKTISVRLYDPEAKLSGDYPHVSQVNSALEACQGANALVIMTAWEEFSKIAPSAVKEVLAKGIVIDAAASWHQHHLGSSDFTYLTLGAL